MRDWFDLKRNRHIGPWNVEKETLVVRYCDCIFKCPICYAAGPSYYHRLIGCLNPQGNAVGKSKILCLLPYSRSYLNNLPRNVLEKLKQKGYVRIQGGEPLWNSPLNSDRPKLTARLAIDSLEMARAAELGDFVCVIQTNGFWLGQGNNAQNFVNWLVKFADEANFNLKEGNYRIAVEISYKAPNEEDFRIFSGTKRLKFRNQIKAYWNLKDSVQNYKAIRVYPVAGFLIPLDNKCGIAPISTQNSPLFHPKTWDNEFEDVINDFRRLVMQDPRYSQYLSYLLRSKNRNKNFITSNGYPKIRGEELEMTGFQQHVVRLYQNFDPFRVHFDNYKDHFKLCPGRGGSRRIYNQYLRIGLRQLNSLTCQNYRNELQQDFFSDQSGNYYPNL